MIHLFPTAALEAFDESFLLFVDWSNVRVAWVGVLVPDDTLEKIPNVEFRPQFIAKTDLSLRGLKITGLNTIFRINTHTLSELGL